MTSSRAVNNCAPVWAAQVTARSSLQMTMGKAMSSSAKMAAKSVCCEAQSSKSPAIACIRAWKIRSAIGDPGRVPRRVLITTPSARVHQESAWRSRRRPRRKEGRPYFSKMLRCASCRAWGLKGPDAASTERSTARKSSHTEAPVTNSRVNLWKACFKSTNRVKLEQPAASKSRAAVLVHCDPKLTCWWGNPPIWPSSRWGWM